MEQPKKFKVKIVNCSLKSYWYSGNVGEVFEVIEFPEMSEVAYCVVGTSLAKWIDKDDCLIIEEDEEKMKEYPEQNKEFPNEKESEKKSNIFYMVWRTSGGSPTKRHDTYDSALEEAKRLANKNPNCEFLVLESKAIVKGKVEIDIEVM